MPLIDLKTHTYMEITVTDYFIYCLIYQRCEVMQALDRQMKGTRMCTNHCHKGSPLLERWCWCLSTCVFVHADLNGNPRCYFKFKANCATVGYEFYPSLYDYEWSQIMNLGLSMTLREDPDHSCIFKWGCTCRGWYLKRTAHKNITTKRRLV